MQTVAVRFIEGEDIFEGELMNPYRIVDDEVRAEFTGDNMLSVLTMNPEDGMIFQSAVHASCVTVMRLVGANDDARLRHPSNRPFDQDA